MAKISWRFVKVRPDMKNRTPMHDSFFDNNKNESASLIREAVQNSLDARAALSKGRKKPAMIRIFCSKSGQGLTWKAVSPFIKDGWKHFEASNSGIRDLPSKKTVCRYLVIEDFGTTGLNGDLKKYSPGRKSNPFYAFFRAEGESDKTGTRLGRWGAGKIVFPKASRIRTFFGLTHRSCDNRQLLTGQSILKIHSVGDDYFQPDGWFGTSEEVICDGTKIDMPMPVSDNFNKNLVNKFKSIFNVIRKREPGLSVVVPYIVDEVTNESILNSVVEDYFWPILSGDLIVRIETDEGPETINQNTLEQFIYAQVISGHLGEDSLAKFRLAQWAVNLPDDEYITVNCGQKGNRPKLTADSMGKDLAKEIRKRLETEEIAIKIPFKIYKREVKFKEAVELDTFIKVFLKKTSDYGDGATVFIREGIIITKARPGSRVPGVVSLLVADDIHVSDFLGNAENPSHTTWVAKTESFRKFYPKGSPTLTFVKNIVQKIITLIDDDENTPDRNLLADIFSVPEDFADSMEDGDDGSGLADSDGSGSTDSDGSGSTDGDGKQPLVKPPPSSKYFKADKIEGGFQLVQGKVVAEAGTIIQVKVFYDTLRGRRKYHSSDFDLSELPMKVKMENLHLLTNEDNHISALVLTSDFSLSITGFDMNKDIYAAIKVIEKENGEEEEDDASL